MKTLKGIAPLIAEVLLIAVVIAMAGILFTWYFGAIQSQSSSTEERTDCAFSNVNIQNVFILQGKIRAIAENKGQTPITITSSIADTASGILSHAQEKIIDANSMDSYEMPFSVSCADLHSLTLYTNCAGVSARFTGTPVCS